ncbi:hypothetical protein BC629DRAFT_1260976, partial [Irpex lacteus]
YKLIGIIYEGSRHFTSRVVASDGSIWYHDGIETGSICIYEGNISNVSPDMFFTAKHARKYSTAIYT